MVVFSEKCPLFANWILGNRFQSGLTFGYRYISTPKTTTPVSRAQCLPITHRILRKTFELSLSHKGVQLAQFRLGG